MTNDQIPKTSTLGYLVIGHWVFPWVFGHWVFGCFLPEGGQWPVRPAWPRVGSIGWKSNILDNDLASKINRLVKERGWNGEEFARTLPA